MPKVGGNSKCKRHKHKLYDGSSALNQPSIRRLARRGGVKRINAGVYDEVPTVLRSWLTKIVSDAIVLSEHGRRMTVVLNDIIIALKRNGMTVYGYDKTEKRRRLTLPLQRENLAAAANRITHRITNPFAHHTPHAQNRALNTTTPNIIRPPVSAAAIKFTNSARTVRESMPNSAITAPHQRAALKLSTRLHTRKSSLNNTTSIPSNLGRLPTALTTTTTAATVPPPSISLDRAFDIQASLSAFRDTVISRKSSSDAPITYVTSWVDDHLIKAGKQSCTAAEVEVVLEALNERDAIMLTDGVALNGGGVGNVERTVWFV